MDVLVDYFNIDSEVDLMKKLTLTVTGHNTGVDISVTREEKGRVQSWEVDFTSKEFEDFASLVSQEWLARDAGKKK